MAAKKAKTVRSSATTSGGGRESVMFQIAQLRQDKIVYMVESSALTFLSFLFYVTVPAVLPTLFGPLGDPEMQRKIVMAVFTIPALYWVYAVIGNVMRLKQIKRLEMEL